MVKRYRTLKLGKLFDRMQELSSCNDLAHDINIISLSEMAKFLNVSNATLRRWVKRKEIIGHVAGNGKIYFLKSDFSPDFSINDNLLTCKDIAKIIGVVPDSVSSWIREGKLVARKYGIRWLVTQDDMQDFLDVGFLT